MPEDSDSLSIKKQHLEIKKLENDLKSNRRKVLFAVLASIITAPYFIPKGYQEYRKSCNENIMEAKKYISLGAISKNEVVGYLEESIVYCRWLFPQVESAVAAEVATHLGKVLVSRPAAPVPVGSDSLQPTNTFAQNAFPKLKFDGWVAVGSTDGSSLFDLSSTNKKITDLKANDTIRAQTNVNIRKGPADWRSPLAEALKGQNFKVLETKTLPAGDVDQIWAKVVAE